MKLTVSTDDRGDITVVTVAGEVDVYTAPQLRSALEECIAAGRTALVVDLQDVGFLDSTGLGVLVGRLKGLKQLDGWLAAVCSDERILRLFGITGLDRVLPTFDTVDEAVAGYDTREATEEDPHAQPHARA